MRDDEKDGAFELAERIASALERIATALEKGPRVEINPNVLRVVAKARREAMRDREATLDVQKEANRGVNANG